MIATEIGLRYRERSAAVALPRRHQPATQHVAVIGPGAASAATSQTAFLPPTA